MDGEMTSTTSCSCPTMRLETDLRTCSQGSPALAAQPNVEAVEKVPDATK